ncbi:hypothetical protein PAXRUDRAFT_835478, partial [Paxillus rubicundulus Ve08.2h10]
QQTILEMQWTIFRLAKFLNHKWISTYLNLSTCPVKQLNACFCQYRTPFTAMSNCPSYVHIHNAGEVVVNVKATFKSINSVMSLLDHVLVQWFEAETAIHPYCSSPFS